MKFVVRGTLFLLVAILSSTLAFAHDPSKHKGRSYFGVAESPTAKGFILKLDGQNAAVSYLPETIFERASKATAHADVKAGEHIKVLGTRLADGSIVATQVLVTDGAASAPAAK